MGTQKIEMGRNRDTDYEMKKRAALAQSQKNSYMQGVQEALGDGSLGDAIQQTRDIRGNVTRMPNQFIQGGESDFAGYDVPGNAPLANPNARTGILELEASSTKMPQTDPQDFETSALDERLSRMAKGGMHNLNDIANLYPSNN